MKQPRTCRKKASATSVLKIHLDQESKTWLAKAAAIRGVSIRDYIQMVTVAQARREVLAARDQVIALTPEEQLKFWKALNKRPRLTRAQRRLGSIMRGES